MIALETQTRLRFVREFLSNNRKFWLLMAWVLGLVALLKGMRLPNTWSATQAQLDYRHGFVKRGLFGAVFTDTLHLNHYARFAAFSFVVFGVALSLLLAMVIRSQIVKRIGSGEIAALFFSSLAFTYLFTLIGYFDILLLAITLSLLLVRHSGSRLTLALVLCPLAVLVHEAFLLLFLPIVLFSFFADTVERRIRPYTALLYAGMLSILCVGTTVVVAYRPSLTPSEAQIRSQEIASRVDFELRGDVLDVLTRSANDNLAIMVKKNLRLGALARLFSTALTFLPVFLLLAVAGWKMSRSSPDPLVRGAGFGMLLGVGIIPLMMNFIGWDYGRWAALACVGLFLGLMLLSRAMTEGHIEISVPLRNVIILVIALNMACGDFLLDTTPKAYPFVRVLRSEVKARGASGLLPMAK